MISQLLGEVHISDELVKRILIPREYLIIKKTVLVSDVTYQLVTKYVNSSDGYEVRDPVTATEIIEYIERNINEIENLIANWTLHRLVDTTVWHDDLTEVTEKAGIPEYVYTRDLETLFKAYEKSI